MKIITYAESKHDLETLKEYGHQSVILSCKELSRMGRISIPEVIKLCKTAIDLNIKPIIEWDILITESDFEQRVSEFQKIPPDLFETIRVQDLGVLEYLLENTNKRIQYIAETGNANFIGLEYLQNYIGERLERLVITSQLPKEKIEEYLQRLKCPIEVLGLGPILLFYSPRMLLSHAIDSKDEFLEAMGESEESPHKGFPLVQNLHGTFMYHIKELCLLSEVSELKKIGVDYFRVDLRSAKNLSYYPLVDKAFSGEIDMNNFKDEYPSSYIKGYYNINKSDVLFKKLKNHRLIRNDEKYLGEVIESIKDKFIVMKLKTDKSLSINTPITYITPEGKKISSKIEKIKNTDLIDIDKTLKNQIVLVNYRSGIWNKSQVYFN